MRVALFGATGFIGSAFLDKALTSGESVSALVRDGARLTPRPGLDVIQGDALDASAIERVVTGADAVVSVLGPRRGDSNHRQFLADAMTIILAAMEAARVTRLVTISGAAIHMPGERKGFPHNIAAGVVSVVARAAYSAKKAELDVLLASSVDWTALRPTRVVEGEASGHPRVSLKAADVGFTVTRGDVAEVLWEQIRERDFVHQAPYVSS